MSQETDHIDDLSSDEAILVEYLDGELTQQDRQAVEERLSREPELREHLARLEKSWQYLDLLDLENTDKELVETTLETVVFSAEEAVQEIEKQSRKRFSWKTVPLLLFFCLVFFIAHHIGGFISGREHFLVPVASPIIERLDLYLMLKDNDPDLELLRLLTEKRIFLQPLPEGEASVDPSDYMPSRETKIEDAQAMHPSRDEFMRRVKKIEDFDETLFNQFYWNYQKFLDLDREQKRQLKKLHEDIARAPRSNDLFQTLQNYYIWFQSLQSYEKAELRQKNFSVEQRVEKIAELKKRLDGSHSSGVGAPMKTDVLRRREETDIKSLAEILSRFDFYQLDATLDEPPSRILDDLKWIRSQENGTGSME